MNKRIRASQFLETFKTEEIEVPSMGGTVLVRELSATERMLISSLAARGQKQEAVETGNVDFDQIAARLGELYPDIIAMGLEDPKMTREQVARVPSKYSEAMMKIATRILLLSGLAEDEPEDEQERLTDPKA